MPEIVSSVVVSTITVNVETCQRTTNTLDIVNDMTDRQQELKPLPTASSPEQRFAEYLQSRGMRSTRQRQVLMDHVFSQHDHFDADQLIDKLPKKGADDYVSRPTVYRTLSEFVDAGLLRKFEVQGRSVYEFDYGYPEHDHLHCTECEELIEFQAEPLEQIISEVAEKHGFRISGHKLIVSGICQKCFREKSRRRKRRVDLI